jgi:diadenylate cyclase
MPELMQASWAILSRFDLRSLLDILLVALIFYLLIILLKGTVAMTLLRGIAILVFFTLILSNLLHLTVLGWLLRTSLTAMLVAIPIIFQPELRRALERIGRTSLREAVGVPTVQSLIDILSRSCRRLAERKYGALIVLERETGLQEYVDTGIRLDATASTELLVSIFFPNSPLHDGAVIIRGNRILAASCVLPLSEHNPSYPSLGTRHRAAIGITERSDAITLVVSEETGEISLASNGRMIKGLDETRLRRLLSHLLGSEARRPLAAWRSLLKG